MFADVTVHNRKSRFLIDTGSSVSILAKCIFTEIGGETSQLQKVEQTLSTADGTPMSILGSAVYEIDISGYETQLTFVIADISGVDGIIGMDFPVLRLMQAKVNFTFRGKRSIYTVTIKCNAHALSLVKKLAFRLVQKSKLRQKLREK